MKKTILIPVICVASVIFLYVIICTLLTYIPLIKANNTNSRSWGQSVEAAETIALDNGAKLGVYPCNSFKNRYVIVCPGGAYVNVSLENEGSCVANEFNKLGYTAFVLEYRVGKAIDEYQAPLDDLANAIKYVDSHADKYNVYQNDYILCGFSAGGNLIGLFGTDKFGYPNYEGVAKPAMLVMGYPWCNPTNSFNGNFQDWALHENLNYRGSKAFLQGNKDLSDMQVPLWVTENYPRTYIAHGENDKIVPIGEQTDVLCEALSKKGVNYRLKRCKNYAHGAGIGIGTDAEGWIKEAVDYLESHIYQDSYEVTLTDIDHFIEKSDGYMCGICHSYYYYDEVANTGAEWVRLDLSARPYNDDGTLTAEYQHVKEYAQSYVDHGFKVMLVTPYPYQYMDGGWDCRTEEGMANIVNAAKFMLEDLRGIVSAYQITNELTEYRFRHPLTMEECATYIGAQLMAMYKNRGDVLIGYNLSATDFMDLVEHMGPYNQYCDYIGIDVYIGCFESNSGLLGMDLANTWATRISELSLDRPIVFTEFGYMSKGKRKTNSEKLQILKSYGAVGSSYQQAEQYAREHIEDIIAHEDFPFLLRETLNHYATAEEKANALFGGPGVSVSYASHLYMELADGVEVSGYPHTEKGQADFYRDFLKKMLNWDSVCGIFIYSLQDEIMCGYCGQLDCPVETGWGMYSMDLEQEELENFDFYAFYTGALKVHLEEKLVVDVVRDGFEKLKEKYSD